LPKLALDSVAMKSETRGNKNRAAKKDRSDRLKDALKANLARRKAQAKVRAGTDKKG